MKPGKLFFVFITCVLPTICFAQVLTISGKVTDQSNSLPIAGASVFVDKAATSTNRNGEFNLVLNKANAMQYGITVSCIGYKRNHVAYQESTFYPVKLQPASIVLKEVVILASPESILLKAIRKIPQNYPNKDFMMEGLLRMNEISRDSLAAYRYYKNDAVIKMYYPSYLNTNKPQVSLVQNRAALLEDRLNYHDTVRSLGAYSLVPSEDFVHSRSDFIAVKGMKNYTYVSQGKGYVNHTRVYIINFFSKEKDQIAGTLYIDTASYAFVSASYTRYNIKQLFFVTIDKSSGIINYKKTGGKWYIDNIKANFAARHNHLDLYHTIDYKTTLIDTVKAEPISYHDRIQYFTEDIKVNKEGTNADWLKNRALFLDAEKDSALTIMPAPAVDTTTIKSASKVRRHNVILDYLRNDNIRTIIQFSRTPVSLSSDQPLLSKKINSAFAYSIGFDEQFRLYKELFLELDGEGNFGIGGISASSANYLLTYNFEFNKQYHPITLSPLFGYNILTLSEHNNNYFNQKSLLYGFTLAYEVKHRLSYFAAIKYVDPFNTYNAGLILNPEKIYPSFGIIYKIK